MAEQEQEARASEPEQARAPDEAAEADARSLRARLAEALGEADQYKGLAQRVQADFVNYKRRVEGERQAQADAVRAETIRAFLPIVDDLERALEHVPSELSGDGWVEGFRLIERKLAGVMERLGLQRFGAEGEPFDPNLHEALAYEEHPTHPEGHIAAVMRPGYQLGDRVVRAAQVSVARAGEQADVPGESWPRHQARQAYGNGGVGDADLHQPRNIDRA
jgi:molecular chaperone GrpE